MINLCVRLRRDEFLTEFRDLFERMSSKVPNSTPNSDSFTTWMEAMRLIALRKREGSS